MRNGTSKNYRFAAPSILLAIAVAVTSAELILRITRRPSAPVIGWASGRPGETNAFGFRGHPFDAGARFRIVLLGDSQVEVGPTAFDRMPEVYLRRAVVEVTREESVSVGSIGGSGWGQDQELLALQRHIGAMRPTVVVLWFTEGNDLWNNVFPTHIPTDGQPKPTFWLERGELAGPNLPWLESYRPSGLYLLQAFRRLRGRPLYPTDAMWEPRLPPAYHADAAPPGTPSLVQALARHRGIAAADVPFFGDENFEIEKTHYSIYLVPESPRLRYAAALTRALLLRIRNVCEENGSKFFVLLTERWDLLGIPEAATLFEVNGKGYTLSSAAARRVIDRVLDGLPTIRITEMPRDAVISKTDVHWNATGNQHVMESVARELETRLRVARR